MTYLIVSKASAKKKSNDWCKRSGILHYFIKQDGPVPAFNDTLAILRGPRDQYDRLAAIIERDPTGIVADVLLPKIVISESPAFSEQATHEMFVIGVRAQARAEGTKIIERDLCRQGFYDDAIVKEVALRRTEEVMKNGLEILAQEISEKAMAQTRVNYVVQTGRELDKRIQETQGEALKAVQDQIASTPEYLALLTHKRDELKKPYEERKEHLHEEFDSHMATALEHVRNNKLSKAYLMLTKVRHDVMPYVKIGASIVQKDRIPPSLFAELLRHVQVNQSSIARYDAQVFYRSVDQVLTVLLTQGDTTLIEHALTPPASWSYGFHRLFDFLNSGGFPVNYLPIEPSALKSLVNDALARPHRE